MGKLLFRKPKFRKWAELEEKKYEVIKAAEENTDQFPLFIFQYISTAFPIRPKDYSKVYWKDAIETFIYVHNVTVPDKVLPLVSKYAEEKSQRDSWDYQGRLWFFYCSVIANAFGWDAKKIASLSINDALAYIQEILTEKQLEREFTWSAAEVAYSYDKATKRSKFQSLHRPYWMRPDFDQKREVKKVRIHKSLIPAGTVIKINADEAKEIKPTGNNKNLLAS